MFLGESTHTLDAKGRVVVPKRFLDALGGDADTRPTVVLTRGFERCLFLFPDAGFQEAVRRMTVQPFAGEEQRVMQRLFFANSHRSQLDAAGRLLVPERLRELAGLRKEVVMVGVADRAEVWSREAWDEFQARHDGDFDRLDRVLLGEAAAPAAPGG